MSKSLKDLFAGIKDAQAGYARTPRFVPGYYDLTVESMDLRESKNPKTRGAYFMITTFKIDSFDGATYDGVAGNVDTAGRFRQGQKVACSYNIADELGLGNAKALAIAIVQALSDPEEADGIAEGLDGDDMARLAGPEQIGVGARVACEVYNHITQSGRDFAICSFSPVWGA